MAVIGLGYVGMTLASVLAMRGFRVYGVDANPDVVRQVNSGETHLYEPGVEDALRAHSGKNWTASTDCPQSPDVAVICVSTPVDAQQKPDLSYLASAAEALGPRLGPETLVIVRSTVPIGTSRSVILPVLQRHATDVRLAYCPERTIQGQALREIQELPQVIGALDSRSDELARAFFDRFADSISPVSTLEAAEMVKLVNNAHTDIIYAYGNEVAMIAQQFKLDPLEIIDSANFGYPRPDLSKPGFVGGGCLTKDPYILSYSVEDAYEPKLVREARRLNEALPEMVARSFLNMMGNAGISPKSAKILVCGFAYKGFPPTDDMRGTAVIPFLDVLKPHISTVFGHDFLVKDEVIRSCGAEPVSLEDGFVDADAVVFLTDHPDYRRLDIEKATKSAKRSLVLFDSWRMFRDRMPTPDGGVHYGGIGYEA